MILASCYTSSNLALHIKVRWSPHILLDTRFSTLQVFASPQGVVGRRIWSPIQGTAVPDQGGSIRQPFAHDHCEESSWEVPPPDRPMSPPTPERSRAPGCSEPSASPGVCQQDFQQIGGRKQGGVSIEQHATAGPQPFQQVVISGGLNSGTNHFTTFTNIFPSAPPGRAADNGCALQFGEEDARLFPSPHATGATEPTSGQGVRPTTWMLPQAPRENRGPRPARTYNKSRPQTAAGRENSRKNYFFCTCQNVYPRLALGNPNHADTCPREKWRTGKTADTPEVGERVTVDGPKSMSRYGQVWEYVGQNWLERSESQNVHGWKQLTPQDNVHRRAHPFT